MYPPGPMLVIVTSCYALGGAELQPSHAALAACDVRRWWGIAALAGADLSKRMTPLRE